MQSDHSIIAISFIRIWIRLHTAQVIFTSTSGTRAKGRAALADHLVVHVFGIYYLDIVMGG